MTKLSETETVIKRILPYLERRGYDVIKDLTFEEPTENDEERIGFIDIAVHCGKKRPLFLIEAKRDGIKLSESHRKQALKYGKDKKCLFVALTNGKEFELLNVSSGEALKINGSSYNRVPSKQDLIKIFLPTLKKDPKANEISLPKDKSLPFRPGIPLTKLNSLIQQCHNIIRKIEKSEETAFADFSKILFLKLLEEKWDYENVEPPYSYLFYELANTPQAQADRVMTAINSMIQNVASKPEYKTVLAENIHLKNPKTYLAITKLVSSISWSDCDLDSKGAAFEYFVRATLKGKKLGQYFTPRPLVRLMLSLGRYEQINKSWLSGVPFKVLDPACGTGGFLVQAMNQSLADLKNELKSGNIHPQVYDLVEKKLKRETFFGIDANDSVAGTAKMNMIIAGDGHSNIQNRDSLKSGNLIPEYSYYDTLTNQEKIINTGKAHLILANPPFGTSESASLEKEDLNQYDVTTTRGQGLFLQKMINSCADDSRIVTVIDEGVLNTNSYKNIRRLILEKCRIEYVISNPEETFKPNKINVKTSVIVLKKRKKYEYDCDLEDDYPIKFIDIQSLGFDGAGKEIRGFELPKLIEEIMTVPNTSFEEYDKDFISIDGYNWKGSIIKSINITTDANYRLDYKYWDSLTNNDIQMLTLREGSKYIEQLNLIETKRGKSPSSSEYVSQDEGYALVVKAGTNIGKDGELTVDGDYIEESTYVEYRKKYTVLQQGDILLASTGTGTLGKCCVYRNEDDEGHSLPAIADGHVTIIRVNTEEVYPEYLCDFLRKGFGAKQIQKLFTGATGLIELQPEEVDRIIVPELPAYDEQIEISNNFRDTEKRIAKIISEAYNSLNEKEIEFFDKSLFGKGL
ncbi:TPA: N-6 DNA methylase [Streptococcus suis]